MDFNNFNTYPLLLLQWSLLLPFFCRNKDNAFKVSSVSFTQASSHTKLSHNNITEVHEEESHHIKYSPHSSCMHAQCSMFGTGLCDRTVNEKLQFVVHAVYNGQIRVCFLLQECSCSLQYVFGDSLRWDVVAGLGAWLQLSKLKGLGSVPGLSFKYVNRNNETGFLPHSCALIYDGAELVRGLEKKVSQLCWHFICSEHQHIATGFIRVQHIPKIKAI